jgi:hypothetical protein
MQACLTLLTQASLLLLLLLPVAVEALLLLLAVRAAVHVWLPPLLVFHPVQLSAALQHTTDMSNM